jgi:hypothetical protein
LGCQITVPLLLQGQLIGTLLVGTDALGFIDQEHLDLAQEAACAVAFALPHNRWGEAGQEHIPPAVTTPGEQLGALLPPLSPIDMIGYVQRLASYLWRTHGIHPGKISCRIDVQDFSLRVDTAVCCGLILHGLISNALKHAFPGDRRGGIYVGLQASDGQLKLVVRDNGEQLADTQNPESTNLGLVRALVDQLDGTIELDRAKGTRYQITFPIPPSVQGRP